MLGKKREDFFTKLKSQRILGAVEDLSGRNGGMQHRLDSSTKEGTSNRHRNLWSPSLILCSRESTLNVVKYALVFVGDFCKKTVDVHKSGE